MSMHAAAVLVYSAYSVAKLIAYRNHGQSTKPQAWHPEESQAVLGKGQEKGPEVLGKGQKFMGKDMLLGKSTKPLAKGKAKAKAKAKAQQLTKKKLGKAWVYDHQREDPDSC